MAKTNAHARSWTQFALPASIVLNLFLAAVIGGHVLLARPGARLQENPLARALANAEASLPASDAAAFSHVLKTDAPRYLGAAQRLAAARQQLGQQITADRFDPDGVRQALEAWRTAWNGFFDAFGGTLVDALAKVSPQGRRKLVAERRATQAGLAPP